MLPKSMTSNQEISRQYKENINQVYDTLTDLVQFSNSLGGKVDSLLQHQQEEFFKAYKSHLTNIKENVVKLQDKIASQQTKIKEYQSEGTIALLLKKIAGLQNQLNNLYGIRTKLMGQLQEQKVHNNVMKTQNQKLSQYIKQLLKNKTFESLRIETQSKQLSREYSISRRQPDVKTIFPTEIAKSPSNMQKSSLKDVMMRNNIMDSQKKMLRNRITSLTTQHNRLLKNTVDTAVLHSQLEGFFLECVETVKREICQRKQIPLCKLSDFRKQDKIHVLNMVLQNDQIISAVYSKLFRNISTTKIKKNQQSISIDTEQVVNNRKRIKHSEFKRINQISSHNQSGATTILPQLKTRKFKNQDRNLSFG